MAMVEKPRDIESARETQFHRNRIAVIEYENGRWTSGRRSILIPT